MQVNHGFFAKRIRQIEQLEAVWDECEGGYVEKFQAVYAELKRKDYSEWHKQKVDRAYAIAFDTELASRLLDTNNDLKTRVTELQKTTTALQTKLNDYVHERVLLSLEIIVMYDSQNLLYDVSPISSASSLFSISGFPEQSYKDIALRFLKAAHKDGYPYFEFNDTGYVDSVMV